MKTIHVDDSVGVVGGGNGKGERVRGCVRERENALVRGSERVREVSWSVWAMEICRKVLDSGDKRLQAKFKHALNVIDRTLALYKSVSIYFLLFFLPSFHSFNYGFGFALLVLVVVFMLVSCLFFWFWFFFSLFNPNFLVQLQLAFVSFFPGVFFFFSGPRPRPPPWSFLLSAC